MCVNRQWVVICWSFVLERYAVIILFSRAVPRLYGLALSFSQPLSKPEVEDLHLLDP